MRVSRSLRRLLTTLGLGYMGIAAWNARVYRRTRNLDFRLPLDGETDAYEWPGGRIFYTRRGQRGQNEPVLLVHGIYAGADSHEWHKVFGPLAERYQVFAYDLLGFGHSARPDVAYSGPLYARLLVDFIRDVIGRPATVIASSLSGGHAIVAASQERNLIRRLILEAPTGATTRATTPRAREQALYLALKLLPDLGQGLANAIGSRASIGWYLRNMAFYNPQNATPDLIDYDYRSVHQPGAQYPLIAFLTGRLNVPVDDALRAASQPLSLFWGRQARVTPLANAQHYLAVRPDARLHVLDSAGLDAIEERPQEFLRQTFDILAGRETGAVTEQELGQMAPEAARA